MSFFHKTKKTTVRLVSSVDEDALDDILKNRGDEHV
jgi:hypothetical protein